MGLFDKIKDNAKTISVRAIEEADTELSVQRQSGSTIITPNPSYPEDTLASPSQDADEPHEITEQDFEPTDQQTETDIDQPEPEVTSEPEVETKPEPETQLEPEPEPIKEEPKETTKKPDPVAEPEAPKKEIKVEKRPEPTKLNVKPYTPSYKQPRTMSGKSGKIPRVIDIAPQRAPESEKRVVYERERAIMATLASQRRLDGTSPLYVTNHLRFKTRVFINRIEYSGSFGKNVIPIDQVAWIKLRAGGTGVIIESTEGKRIVMVIRPADRLNFADAVLKVQSMQPKKAKFKDTKTIRIDQLDQMEEGIDELEKLAKLLDKGILTQEEFDTKKKQILGI
ncbi:MAG: SHOCT domain-containing protein [bacterium]|nr:SHOCT domain-containing protein [bacterium]